MFWFWPNSLSRNGKNNRVSSWKSCFPISPKLQIFRQGIRVDMMRGTVSRRRDLISASFLRSSKVNSPCNMATFAILWTYLSISTVQLWRYFYKHISNVSRALASRAHSFRALGRLRRPTLRARYRAGES